jgi:hypothetical protein
MTPRRLLGMLLVLAAGLVAGSSGHVPAPAWAATCADYPTQAAAQAAGDTRDADGDGIYCESLPCPCSTDPPVRTPPPTTTVVPPAPTTTTRDHHDAGRRRGRRLGRPGRLHPPVRCAEHHLLKDQVPAHPRALPQGLA